MTTKSVFIIGALALATLNIASAKSYNITLGGPTKIGNMELQAGNYKIQVNGSEAVFTDTESDKSFTAPVKVESNDKKFDQTRVETNNQNGADNLREIDLGGSTTKLEFGQ